MPLNLSQGVALVASTPLQTRVAMAFYYVAREVLEEGAGEPAHEQRINFAYSITRQNYQEFLPYVALIVTDDAIVAGGPYGDQAGITDIAILTAVRTMWNTLSGVPAA